MAKWRVNILCLIGFAIGEIALYLSWQDYYYDGDFRYSLTILQNRLIPFGVMVLMATTISILTPLGGFRQLALVGYYLYRYAYISSIDFHHSVAGIGAWLSLFSAIVILVSIIKPIGIGYGRQPLKLQDRLLTFSKIPESASVPPLPT